MPFSRLCHATVGSACLVAAATASAQPAPPPASLLQESEHMKVLLREKLPPPLAPLPRPPADLRDLRGTWIANQLTALRITQDMDGAPIPLTAEGQRILERRTQATYVEGKPFANAGAMCLPPGQPWQLGLLYPFRILQSGSAVVFTFSEYHTVWGISLAPAASQPTTPAFMGQSSGHWEGNELVVDVRGFKRALWVDADGTPASTDAHLTLRIARVDGPQPTLRIITKVDDPRMFSRPWSFVRTYAWRPDMEVFSEYDCESVATSPDALSQYGLRPEGEQP